MRILAFDLGIKRTGMAICDDLGLSIRPLGLLKPCANRQEAVSAIIEIALAEQAQMILLGHATLTSGKDTPMSKRAEGLRLALKEEITLQKLSIQVALQNEYSTSKQALKNLATRGVKQKNRRLRVDIEAACLILEDYLLEHKKNI